MKKRNNFCHPSPVQTTAFCLPSLNSSHHFNSQISSSMPLQTSTPAHNIQDKRNDSCHLPAVQITTSQVRIQTGSFGFWKPVTKFPNICVCKNTPSHNSILSAGYVICHTLSVNLQYFPQYSKLYQSHHCMHASAASAIFSFHLSNFLKQRTLYPMRLCCPFLFRNPTY